MMNNAPQHCKKFPGPFFHLRSAPLRVTLMMNNAPQHCKKFPGGYPLKLNLQCSYIVIFFQKVIL
jgi:hypothetical protein